MKKRIRLIAGGLAALLIVLGAAVAWYFTSQALYPSWQIAELGPCPPRRIEGFGEACGDLRRLGAFVFEDVKFRTDRGYEIPAWYIPVDRQANPAQKRAVLGLEPGRYAAFFVHGGGADRREGYRLARYFIDRGIDYYMPDLTCHGMAACPHPGLSFGAREHLDVVDVFNAIHGRYDGVFVLGTSVGANSTLMALPKIPDAKAIVAENPMYSTRRFVRDTGAAPAFLPGWYRDILFKVLEWRGGFDGSYSSAVALKQAASVGIPVLFLHGTADRLIPVTHSQDLAALYRENRGPAEIHIVDGAEHARVWNAGPAAYEAWLDEFFKAAVRPRIRIQF